MDSNINFWQIFLLISASQGVLLSFALISSTFLKKWSNLFLGIFVFTISIEILNVWAIQVNYHEKKLFPFWNLSSYWLFPASIFFWSKLNTQAQFKLKKLHFLFFLPAIVDIVFRFTSYHLYKYQFWFVFVDILPLVAIIIVLILFAIDIYKFTSKHKNIPKNKHKFHLLKVKVVYGIFSLITLLWFLEVFFQLNIFGFTLLVLCLISYIVAYISFFRPDSFDLPKFLMQNTKAIENSADAETLNKLRQLFEEDKIYLKPKLSLKETAEILQLSPRYLSNLINAHHQMDFRNYVNTFRVEEVVKKVKAGEHEQKTLLGIALESGFNSKSAFNETFKMLKGKSPSKFFKSTQ